jgi:hypothetical protein
MYSCAQTGSGSTPAWRSAFSYSAQSGMYLLLVFLLERITVSLAEGCLGHSWPLYCVTAAQPIPFTASQSFMNRGESCASWPFHQAGMSLITSLVCVRIHIKIIPTSTGSLE